MKLVTLIFIASLLGLVVYFSIKNDTDKTTKTNPTPISETTKTTKTTKSETTKTTKSELATLQPTCVVRTNVPDGFLNLRAGSGLSFGVIKVLHEGEELEDLAENTNGFTKVRSLSSNVTGWVRDLYITCTE